MWLSNTFSLYFGLNFLTIFTVVSICLSVSKRGIIYEQDLISVTSRIFFRMNRKNASAKFAIYTSCLTMKHVSFSTMKCQHYILLGLELIFILWMLGNFSCFCWCVLTFFKINFFKIFFQEHYQSVNSVDPDQDWHNLIWVQTVCKGYQVADNKVAASKEKIELIGNTM